MPRRTFDEAETAEILDGPYSEGASRWRMGEGTNFRPGDYFSQAREDARSGLRCAHGMARPTGFFARDSIRNAPISPVYLRL